MKRLAIALVAALSASPLFAKDSLGMFDDWGAFRDPTIPRCYAISKAEPSRLQRDFDPFVTVGTWPRRSVRNQVHFRLSRRMSPAATIRLRVGNESFELVGGGGDAWAENQAMDAAIIAAMRSSSRMTVSARDRQGRNFSNTYSLSGVATAMDAATIGCARRR